MKRDGGPGKGHPRVKDPTGPGEPRMIKEKHDGELNKDIDSPDDSHNKVSDNLKAIMKKNRASELENFLKQYWPDLSSDEKS